MAFCDVLVFLLMTTWAPVATTGLCHQEDCPSSSFLSLCSHVSLPGHQTTGPSESGFHRNVCAYGSGLEGTSGSS